MGCEVLSATHVPECVHIFSYFSYFSYFFYIGSGVSCLCDCDQPGRAECRRDCPQANQRGVRSSAPGGPPQCSLRIFLLLV